MRFYENIFGFPVIADFGERGCAMDAGIQQVLLLFKKGGSRSFESTHGGDGELHIAFATAVGELSRWELWLAENESRSRRNVLGMVADGGSTSAIPTATCSNSSRPVPGVSTEGNAFRAAFVVIHSAEDTFAPELLKCGGRSVLVTPGRAQ